MQRKCCITRPRYSGSCTPETPWRAQIIANLTNPHVLPHPNTDRIIYIVKTAAYGGGAYRRFSRLTWRKKDEKLRTVFRSRSQRRYSEANSRITNWNSQTEIWMRGKPTQPGPSPPWRGLVHPPEISLATGDKESKSEIWLVISDVRKNITRSQLAAAKPRRCWLKYEDGSMKWLPLLNVFRSCIAGQSHNYRWGLYPRRYSYNFPKVTSSQTTPTRLWHLFICIATANIFFLIKRVIVEE